MSRHGACPCGAVRYEIDGPVRDVIVCHCDACQGAHGRPWHASAARRSDLVIEDASALRWQLAAVSAYDASRGLCRNCGAYVLWDAPGRETVSFSVETLDDGGAGLAVLAHIWVPETDRRDLVATGLPVAAAGLPADVGVAWHETPG